MSHENLISLMRSHRGPRVDSLDAYFDEAGPEAWYRLIDVARMQPTLVDDQALDCARARVAQAPGCFFALLLTLAARDEPRKGMSLELFRRFLPEHPAEALQMAGIHLHEYCRLLDEEWLSTADRLFDRNPEGAWGIFESASMYRSNLVTDPQIESFEERRRERPRAYFVSLLSLAAQRPDRVAGLLERVLRAFPEHPAEAVEAASFSARSVAALLTPALVGAVVRHFEASPEKAWEFFDGAVRELPDLFDACLLDTLTARSSRGPGTLFSILRHLIGAQPDRGREIMDRYVALVRTHPEQGIQSARFGFQRED